MTSLGWQRVVEVAALAGIAALYGSASLAASPTDTKEPVKGVLADEVTPQAMPKPTPAFPGQTEAPERKSQTAYTVQTVTTDLAYPWSLAFLPDGKMLVSELEGTLRLVTKDGVHSRVDGMPPVKTIAAQGLHDLALDPNFARNRLIYFTYFAPPPGEGAAFWPSRYFYEQIYNLPVAARRTLQIGMERVGRARLSDDETRVENAEVILEGAERRLAFAPDGTLFATGADRFRFYNGDLSGGKDAPETDPTIRKNFAGRVSRINTDGTIPKDNPFLDEPLVPPDVYSFGHRDPEGAAINPRTGELWAVEHGPAGGDELNIIRAGRDYGWPVISYGRQYVSGKPVGSGRTQAPGMEQPIYFWFPDIAPSGLMFYTGDRFPEWKGNLFLGALAGQALVRLVLDGDRVVGEERLQTDPKHRVRDVRQGPDGMIYLLTTDGSLLRIVPKG